MKKSGIKSIRAIRLVQSIDGRNVPCESVRVVDIERAFVGWRIPKKIQSLLTLLCTAKDYTFDCECLQKFWGGTTIKRAAYYINARLRRGKSNVRVMLEG
jgi:hypothetical protein